MPSTRTVPPAANLRAIVMMVTAMTIFALADTCIRLASLAGNGATAGQFIVFQSIAGTIMFTWLLRRQGGRLTPALLKNRNVHLRTIGDLLAAACMVTSLTLLPVGTVSAILQVQPLMVTIAAALILKERVGINRWSAVIIGLVGCMIIMRPGMTGFEPASLLVLLGVIGLTMRDIYTRKLEVEHSSTAAVLVVSMTLLPVGIALHMALAGSRPLWEIEQLPLVYVVLAGTLAMFGYYVLVLAMRIGEISAVAPFRYSRLVAAFAIAWLLLGEVPDAITIAGSAIVVAAGIIVALRERRARRLATL